MNRRWCFVATLAVSATPVLFGATAATSGLRATAIQSPPQFEVASVKINRSAIGKVEIQGQLGGRFTATNVTLRQLIQRAYQLQAFWIVGGPSWMPTDRFDIVAKAEGDGSRESGQVDTAGAPSREQLMLRTLLAERFSLSVHTDTKELPIYALVVAQRNGTPGPRLRPSAQACESRDVDSRTQNRQAPSVAEIATKARKRPEGFVTSCFRGRPQLVPIQLDALLARSFTWTDQADSVTLSA